MIERYRDLKVALNYITRLAISFTTLAVLGCSLDQGSSRFLNEFYPEAKGVSPHQTGLFQTGRGIRVNYFNFVPLKFNPEASKRLYTLYEQIAEGRSRNSYKIGDKVSHFQAVPLKNKNDIGLFIIPEDLPQPSWAPSDMPGVTLLRAGDLPHLSRIVLYEEGSLELEAKRRFGDNLHYANLTLDVEACQASIFVRGQNSDHDVLGQEFFCNTVGTAVAHRQRALPHSIYKLAVQGYSIRIPPGVVSIATLDEKEYFSIPSITPSLTR